MINIMKNNLPKSSYTIKYNVSGFTLIELLVVIGILTGLLAITLVALNPSRQFAQSDDTQRRSDVNAILNAVHQYAADNRGSLPGDDLEIPLITSSSRPISTAEADICSYIVPLYIAQIPQDPDIKIRFTACDTEYTTGYSISRTADNRVTVVADTVETPEAASITVTR